MKKTLRMVGQAAKCARHGLLAHMGDAGRSGRDLALVPLVAAARGAVGRGADQRLGAAAAQTATHTRLALSFIVVAAVALLAGCGTTGSGTHWYAPATWFSHAPAAAVDTAKRNEARAEQAAIKRAQQGTHETEIALGTLAFTAASREADTRAVATARASNRLALGLLDQVAGPLTAAELASLQSTVAGLLSDNAEVRATAERNHARDTQAVKDVSDELARAQAASEVAGNKLRAAFERENQLANELRTAHALHWILGACAVLALAGWVYVRYFLGGLPGALGGALASLERSHPEFTGTVAQPGPLRVVLNQLTNRHEQATICNAYLKSI